MHTPPSQTWRTFLANHVRDLVSLDFFTVPTASLRVFFVLVVLAPQRRRVVHFNVTEHPTAAWTAQQLVDTFPDDTAPSLDKDAPHGRPIEGPAAGRVGRFAKSVASTIDTSVEQRKRPAEPVICTPRREPFSLPTAIHRRLYCRSVYS